MHQGREKIMKIANRKKFLQIMFILNKGKFTTKASTILKGLRLVQAATAKSCPENPKIYGTVLSNSHYTICFSTYFSKRIQNFRNI